MAKKRSRPTFDYPIEAIRTTVSTAADGTPVYAAIAFDLNARYVENEVVRLLRHEMWLSNSAAIDDPPSDGVTRVRTALLDDPNAVIDIATASEFTGRPEIIDYMEAVWSAQIDAAPVNKVLNATSTYKSIDFPGGGILVGRDMQLTSVVDETASMFGLAWETRSVLWFKRERVSDAKFKQILYQYGVG